MTTSKSITSPGLSYDVNHRAAHAMADQGKEALAEFYYLMGMPPPSRESSWMLHNNAIHATSQEMMEKECKEEGIRLRQQLKQDDESISDTSLLDVMVS